MMVHGTVFVLLMIICPILVSKLYVDYDVCPSQSFDLTEIVTDHMGHQARDYETFR
jgi:hypothetical protein